MASLYKPHLFSKKIKNTKKSGRTVYRKIAFNPKSNNHADYLEWRRLWWQSVNKRSAQIKIRLLGKVKKCSMLWSEGELEVQGNNGEYHYAKTGGSVFYSIKGDVYCGFNNEGKGLNAFLVDFNMQKALLL